MAKFLEFIGDIDGHSIEVMGKRKAKNDAIFEEIEKYDASIKEKARSIINSHSGKVIAIYKERKNKGYLFV